MSKTICIFGDSIAWGAFDNERGGWAEMLKTYFFGKDRNIYNLGISGDNTNKLIKRFYSECATRKPDIIIFAIGENDSQDIKSTGGKRVEIGKFKSNLRMMIKQGEEFGKIIFVGPVKVDEAKTAPVIWNNDRTYLNEHILKYTFIIESLCEENNLPFIRMFDLLTDKDLADGLHPNSAGHRKMFERVKKFLDNYEYTK